MSQFKTQRSVKLADSAVIPAGLWVKIQQKKWMKLVRYN